MSFMESYKRLERLCGDTMNDERKVSAYIDAMSALPKGEYLVAGWTDDLKKLKHYRWIRNQISHESGCTEENMSTSDDTQWIDNFYARILRQQDPLTLYRKAIRTKNATTENVASSAKKQIPINTEKNRKKDDSKIVNAALLACILVLIGAIIIMIGKIISFLL